MADQRTLIPRNAAQAPFYIGIDIGGTTIKGGVVDDRGAPLSYIKMDTEVEKGGEDACRRIAKMIADVTSQADLTKTEVAAVGVGCPGPMDIPRGKLLEPINLKGWEDFPVRDRIGHHAGLSVTFNNDANAAAYGEFWVGSGKQFSSLILLTLGTGVGGGIIIDHLSIDGEHSHGGELGHIIIDPHENARTDNRGYRGHLEAYASATAVIKRTQEALDTGRASSLKARLGRGETLTPILVGEEAERGDPLALEIVLETARYLGIGITTLCHTIDPAAVIIGGAMTFGREKTPIGRRFLARIQEEVQRLAFPQVAQNVKILYGSLGGDAGFIGAAGLARLGYRQSATTLGPPAE